LKSGRNRRDCKGGLPFILTLAAPPAFAKNARNRADKAELHPAIWNKGKWNCDTGEETFQRIGKVVNVGGIGLICVKVIALCT
jgi:hypothetical protein